MRILCCLFLAVLMTMALLAPITVNSQGDLRERIKEVYTKLVVAEQRGANVTYAAIRLDEALEMVDEANGLSDPAQRLILLSKAEGIVDEVDAFVPELSNKGESETVNSQILAVITSLALIVVGILVYFYGPRMLWGLWLRARADWKVRKRDR